ncbi:MAG: hypothetical protein V1897_05610 [Pseudomonadota bacterium]
MNSKCKKCGGDIKWCMMASGAKMPLDAKPKKFIQVKEGIGEVIDVYESHFATCPAADQFRRG